MCGILFTNKTLNNVNLDYVLEYLKKRGPDSTNIVTLDKYLFIHTLLSMTGPPTEQPFYNDSKDIICIFNGEIYNFLDFGDYESDGQCLIPLYEKYGDEFISQLDGEFAILLVDFSKNKLIASTDIFSTRPLWIGFDNFEFGISTYKSCLDRIGLVNNFQVLANTTYIIDLENLVITEEKSVHTFDLNQYKTTFDDWNTAFANSIKKRVQFAKCGVFIGLSAGYDSGAIACELTKQNVNFTAYSIANVEDKEVLNNRCKLIKNCELIQLEHDDFLQAREYLKKNAEEYNLNIDNGEKEAYNDMILDPKHIKSRAESLLKVIKFRKHEQVLTDDNGAIGCSYICNLAKSRGQKIYLSGSGADEIFSDYGFNGVKYYNHSTIGGHFPDDLESVFPWKNFFKNTQRAYLMKEEHVAGAYGIEGRYPFLDKYVVQEFLWLSAELKNSMYKAPLDNYLRTNNFPYKVNQKIGFGCGFLGNTYNNRSYSQLSESDISVMQNKKVTDVVNIRAVNFDKLLHRKTRSYEEYYVIDTDDIKYVSGNMYCAKIKINYPGSKYFNKSRYTLQEDEVPLISPTNNHKLITKIGNGYYCFWTSDTLYFSSSDNSDPRTNNKQYSIIKLHTQTNIKSDKYHLTIVIRSCITDSDEYFKIRSLFNELSSCYKALICDNYELFMDMPNVKFVRFSDTDTKNNIINNSKMVINEEDLTITNKNNVKGNLSNVIIYVKNDYCNFINKLCINSFISNKYNIVVCGSEDTDIDYKLKHPDVKYIICDKNRSELVNKLQMLYEFGGILVDDDVVISDYNELVRLCNDLPLNNLVINGDYDSDSYGIYFMYSSVNNKIIKELLSSSIDVDKQIKEKAYLLDMSNIIKKIDNSNKDLMNTYFNSKNSTDTSTALTKINYLDCLKENISINYPKIGSEFCDMVKCNLTNFGLKILISSTQYPGYGGAATNAYNLHKYFKKLGFNVASLFFHTEIPPNYDPDKLGYVYLEKYPDKSQYNRIHDTVTGALNGAPDIILAKNYMAPILCKEIFPDSYVVYLVSGINHLSSNFPQMSAYDFLALPNEKIPPFSVEIQCNDLADTIVTNSKLCYEIFNKIYNTTKLLKYAINTSEIETLKIDRYIETKYRPFTFFVSVSNFKRLTKNIAFLDKILKYFNGYTKCMIGECNEEFKGRYSNAYFFGLLSNNDAVKMSRQCKICLQPSYFESNSNALMEAYQNGCLFVTTKNLGIAHMLPSYMVCDGFDTDEWIQKIQYILDNYEYLVQNTKINFSYDYGLLDFIENFNHK